MGHWMQAGCSCSEEWARAVPLLLQVSGKGPGVTQGLTLTDGPWLSFSTKISPQSLEEHQGLQAPASAPSSPASQGQILRLGLSRAYVCINSRYWPAAQNSALLGGPTIQTLAYPSLILIFLYISTCFCCIYLMPKLWDWCYDAYCIDRVVEIGPYPTLLTRYRRMWGKTDVCRGKVACLRLSKVSVAEPGEKNALTLWCSSHLRLSPPFYGREVEPTKTEVDCWKPQKYVQDLLGCEISCLFGTWALLLLCH